MFRNIQHLSSEDFRPKRPVFAGFGADLAEGAYWNPARDKAKRAEAGSTRREAIRGTRGALGHVRKEVEDAVNRALDRTPQQWKEMYDKVVGEDGVVDWEKANDALNKALILTGTENATATEKVRALQQVVFKALGVLNQDPAAKVDGRLGPYTLAALARYAKIQNPPPVPEGNKHLSAYRSNKSETESPSAEPPGAAFLTGAVRQPDGSYRIEREGVKTYLKFENGAWLWTAEPNSGPWTPVVQRDAPADPTDEVNVMLDKLTPEALQAERKRLEDFIEAAKKEYPANDSEVADQRAAAIEDAERALAELTPQPVKAKKSTPGDYRKALEASRDTTAQWLRDNAALEFSGDSVYEQAKAELTEINRKLAETTPPATTAATSAAPAAAAPSANPWSTELPVTPNPDKSTRSPEELAYDKAVERLNKASVAYGKAEAAFQRADAAVLADDKQNLELINAYNKASNARTAALRDMNEAQAALTAAIATIPPQGPELPAS